MTYAYIRVSTEKQTVENQRHEIKNFATKKSFIIDKWVEETISAGKKLEERKLNNVLKRLKKGDILIVTEISRVGRNLLQIMSILNLCMDKEAIMYTIKEGYELGDNINSKVLAFAFGLSAEIERSLISQRTKEALARLKAEGRKLGRPAGSIKSEPKLAVHADYIKMRLKEGAKQIEIARSLKVCRQTVSAWVRQNNLSKV